MKLQTQSSKALAAALAKSAKCISNKNAMAILDCVLLMKRDDNFVFVTSNTFAQLTIPAPLSVVEGKFEGKVALPVAVISAFLSTLPDCVITFDFAENGSHSLTMEYCTGDGAKVKNGKVTVAYFDGTDFPFIKTPTEDVTHIQLPMAFFGKVLERAEKFVGHDELRAVMNCLCLDLAEDFSQVVAAASDTRKLIRFAYTNDPKTGGGDFYRGGKAGIMLIHSQYFRIMSAFDGCESVDIECDGDMVRMTSGDIELVCKSVDGKYPNYKGAIPAECPNSICVDKKEVLEVIKRISLFGTTDSKLVVLRKDGMFLNVSAQNVDFAQAAEDQALILDSQCPDGFRIGFNAENLASCVSAISTDSVRIKLTDASRAAVFVADEPSPSSLTLCVPLLLNNE